MDKVNPSINHQKNKQNNVFSPQNNNLCSNFSLISSKIFGADGDSVYYGNECNWTLSLQLCKNWKKTTVDVLFCFVSFNLFSLNVYSQGAIGGNMTFKPIFNDISLSPQQIYEYKNA